MMVGKILADGNERNKKTKMTIGLIITFVVIVLIGWWLSDIPIGYYQFQQICRKEGGVRSYENVLPNVGWITSTASEAKDVVSTYQTVSFARFVASKGVLKDVRYKGGNPWWSTSYDISLADVKDVPRYNFDHSVEPVSDAIRLRKNIIKLTDLFTNQVVLQSTRYIFTWTTPENTLLGMSGTKECPPYKDEILSIKTFLRQGIK